jgi:hypothetical protein
MWDHNECVDENVDQNKKKFMNKNNKNKMDFSKSLAWSPTKIPPKQCTLYQ